MSSKKITNTNQTKESLITDDAVEINEIVGKHPESEKESKTERTGQKARSDSFTIVVEKLFSSLGKAFGSMQRETKKLLCISAVVGVLLLSVIIILSVRLGGVTKALKSVQAMSASLQEELEATRQEMKTAETTVEEKPSLFQQETSVLKQTPTPGPTHFPEPEKYIVCVDAGHGDWDGGAVMTVNGVAVRAEKEDNLWMADLFRDALENYGVEVIMTRETDVFVGLSERARIANAAGADALISFHRNSYDGTNEVNGVEFWIHNSRPAGAEALAQSMLAAVAAVGGMENRGVKYGTITSARDNYAINREANMTSMIVELGFITSTSDNAAYDTYGKAYAEEMAKAVFEWLEAQKTVEN